jgi:hypothetical protein
LDEIPQSPPPLFAVSIKRVSGTYFRPPKEKQTQEVKENSFLVFILALNVESKVNDLSISSLGNYVQIHVDFVVGFYKGICDTQY